jgi:sigma-54 specific flagellar transcriptional regulator A
MHYAWPGNVRELANLVERLSILFPDRLIGVAELPLKYRPPGWVPGSEREERLVIAEDCGIENVDAEASSEALNASDANTAKPTALQEEQALRLLTAVRSPTDDQSLAQLPEQGLDLRMHLYNIERALIQQALERSSGTVAHAARLLQLRRTTLVEKLRKLDLLTDAAASALFRDSEAS